VQSFNGSIWNALWVLTPIAVAIYLALFLGLRGHHYFFDPRHNSDPRLKAEGRDFEPHAKRYQDLAKLGITLSAAGIAFLVGITFTDRPAASPVLAARIQAVAPIVAGFFGFSIALLVLFMVYQALNYEAYCHSPEHNTYTRWKYALSTCLGYTGLLAFVLGFGWLARNLFRR
jgi:hypothetical protein